MIFQSEAAVDGKREELTLLLNMPAKNMRRKKQQERLSEMMPFLNSNQSDILHVQKYLL